MVIIWGRRVLTRVAPVLGKKTVGLRKESTRPSRMILLSWLKPQYCGRGPMSRRSSHIHKQHGAGFMER